MKADPEQVCPICSATVAFNGRYPRYACPACAARAADETGRLLSFSNADMVNGKIQIVGFAARYLDTDEVRDSHVCYIDGVECWADEARFGGIVIETTKDSA